MKSAAYIAVFLSLQAFTIVYPQDRIERRIERVPADTAAIRKRAEEVRKAAISSESIKAVDTTKILYQDTTAIDSVRVRFLPGMGQINEFTDTSGALHQRQFIWTDAKVVGDLIYKMPGFFYRDLGEAGKWGQLNAYGLDDRNISFLLDGRPMNDPITGAYNISDLPLEFINYAEIISGAGSISNISDISGTMINFVSRSYNSVHPMTKLRFVQDPKGTLLTDGLFTQNVARGLNLMIGFTRQVTDGRFSNADLDAWNVRVRLRYNISDRLNISLTDFYTKSDNGLNGGVDRTFSPDLDPAGSKIVNYFSWDKRSRQDIALSSVARIFPDSSSLTRINLYYTSSDREYYSMTSYTIGDFTRLAFWGLNIQQKINLNLLNLSIGGSLEQIKTDSTRTLASHSESRQSLSLQAELLLADIFIPSISLGSTSYYGENSISTGAGVKSTVADWLILHADAAWFDRFPTFLEKFWSDSTFLRSGEIEKEQHTFYRAGLTIKPGTNLEIGLEGFTRNIDRAIVLNPALTTAGNSAISISNVKKVAVRGVNASAVLRFYKFEATGILTYSEYKENDTVKTLYPDIIVSGELSYRNTFFNDKLDAKFGVRTQFLNHQQSMRFDPQTLSYSRYNSLLLGRSTTLDLFMILKIGDAHLTLAWQNVLNATYILSPVYPMPPRSLRLGVNWVFLD